MAGSDAGHAFPALALATAFAAGGDKPIVYTGEKWAAAGESFHLDVRPLPGLAPRPGDDDDDAGAKLSVRAARMALELAPELAAADVDIVLSDAITLAGGWAAELVGVPWIEVSPHPLYDNSLDLPPIGAGMVPGTGIGGKFRDIVLRAGASRSTAKGHRQRVAARRSIELSDVPQPIARFVATLPGLELARSDWPVNAHLVGPLLFEPTTQLFDRPACEGPLIVVAPSTAATGSADLGSVALAALARLQASRPLRVVYSALHPPQGETMPEGLVAATARQDELLPDAALVVCGAGHGMLAKTLMAGVPVVTVPGGGDQWELANRVNRIGCGVLVRPATEEALMEAIVAVLDDPGYVAAAEGVAATAAGVVDPVVVTHRAYADAVNGYYAG
ncbi:glycosyltransferase [Gordonia sp. (in: high G+C Gram-positive bacteria)]|uniref:glycosyltransferase n=1 Tax=Gordonia sp. (in: high G+C Gram-positive bacteria) TaxID=84139 RepID=UPI003C77CD40